MDILYADSRRPASRGKGFKVFGCRSVDQLAQVLSGFPAPHLRRLPRPPSASRVIYCCPYTSSRRNGPQHIERICPRSLRPGYPLSVLFTASIPFRVSYTIAAKINWQIRIRFIPSSFFFCKVLWEIREFRRYHARFLCPGNVVG